METVIQFTPAQLIAMAAAIITVSGAVGVLVNLFTKLKSLRPNRTSGSITVRNGSPG